MNFRTHRTAGSDQVLSGPLYGPPVQPAAAPLHRPLLLHLSFLLYAFTIPFESMNVAFDLGPLSLARMSGLLFFAMSFLNLRRAYAAPRPPFWWLLGYLWLYIITGSLISDEYKPAFFVQLLTIVQLLVFFWIASNLLQDDKFARKVMLSYALAAGTLTAAVELRIPGFSQTMANYQGERTTVLNANPNYLAMVLALAAIILAGMALSKNTRSVARKWPLVFLMMMVLIFLVQTGSRAGLAAFILGTSCFIWPSGLTKRKIVPILLVVGALASAGYLLFHDPDSVSRWSDTLFRGDSAGRDDIYASAFSMVFDRPFFGWRPVEYQVELARRNGESVPMRDPHNLVLHVLLEVGFIGSLIFFTAVFLCARGAWRSRGGALGILPTALMVTLVIGLQFHNWMTNKPLWFVLAICAAAPKTVRNPRPPGTGRFSALDRARRVGPFRSGGKLRVVDGSRS